jgi:N-acetylglucosaminyl-diphospho-decaprenol L-rhamnosyltransferase
MELVDVVVVSYNSREVLRGCVEPLAGRPEFLVTVVDNDSPDRSLDAVVDLDLSTIARDWNAGFARACNDGWRSGRAPLVLFLNPDARLDPDSLGRLVDVLRSDDRVGVVGPRIVDFDGSLVHSQRRFLNLVSVWAQAMFLHHLLLGASWTDGIVRRPAAYASASSPDWISGACMLVRRSTLERLEGFDERFFMYCEDMDLCRRVRRLGLDVRFEPSALAHHGGGGSAPRAALFHVHVESRWRFLALYSRPGARSLGRLGLAVGELIRVVVTRGGASGRVSHLRGLCAVLKSQPRPPSEAASSR